MSNNIYELSRHWNKEYKRFLYCIYLADIRMHIVAKETPLSKQLFYSDVRYNRIRGLYLGSLAIIQTYTLDIDTLIDILLYSDLQESENKVFSNWLKHQTQELPTMEDIIINNNTDAYVMYQDKGYYEPLSEFINYPDIPIYPNSQKTGNNVLEAIDKGECLISNILSDNPLITISLM